MTGGADGRGTHVFTVDVEEYFQVHAFDGLVQTEEWDCFPSRVERATDQLLELLEARGVVGTFFVVGWVAERHRDLVRRIAAAGHEVASHSWWHRPVTELSRAAFRRDARDSKALLEEITGEPVHGYRAPGFSLVPETEWMLEILVEEGYRYDSSLYPSRTLGRFEYPGARRRPDVVNTRAGRILELPMTTARWAGFTVPVAGGAYLRHLPYPAVRAGLEQAEREGQAGVFYVHPWELDSHQPMLPVPLLTRLRHYGNLERTLPRLERLLEEFSFTSARERFGLAEPAEEREGELDAGGRRRTERRRAHG